MRTPSTANLLNMWEKGLHQGSISRALTLLEAFCPEEDRESLAQLSIGDRDAQLLCARQLMFGPRLVSTVTCPRCSERLDWEAKVADLFVTRAGVSARDSNRLQGKENFSLTNKTRDILEFASGDCRITFRLPNSDDLSSLSGQSDAAALRKQLLECCLIEASQENGEPLSFCQLPMTVLQGMVQAMERADPQSNLIISLTCPACNHHWEAGFDIVPFLWAEINNWAQHTLRTIHTLARAYCWGEAEVLAMSPTRRQIYLEMARQ